MKISLDKYFDCVNSACPIRVEGQVTKVLGNIIEGNGPAMPIGGICHILPSKSVEPINAEVIGFRDQCLLLMPLNKSGGVEPGSSIVGRSYTAQVNVGFDMLGRIVDGLGSPLDNGPPLRPENAVPLYSQPINPLHRSRISEPLDVGIRSIDCLNTLAKGQRTAIMAGSGVG